MGNTRWDAWVAGVCGTIGGMIDFSNSLISITYWQALVKAGLTALVCGFLGVAGKHLFSMAVKWVKTKRK